MEMDGVTKTKEDFGIEIKALELMSDATKQEPTLVGLCESEEWDFVFTCFIADMDDFSTFNEVYASYFTGKPARSCVAVKTFPKNVLCEIEAVAYLDK